MVQAEKEIAHDSEVVQAKMELHLARPAAEKLAVKQTHVYGQVHQPLAPPAA